MSQAQIIAEDVASWETLDDIAASLEKRGLKPRRDLDRENGYENELLVEIDENKYIALIDAAPGDDPSDYNKFQSSTVPTTFVSTRDFQTFSVIRRKRIIGGDKHGRLGRQKFSFDKEQITSGDRYSALDKLNDIEYGNDSSLDNLFDTRQVVDEFYEKFESIRTDLVAKVEGIPDDRGDAKQRYVQVTLNRLIFLHFIQEKGLLGAGEDDYLLTKHDEFAVDGDVQTEFYEPLFFKALAEEGFQSRKFDRVPYLNGGLFSETPVEQEFEDARLGADAEESDDLYWEILEFLDSWNWNVDERLDVVEPKNLSPSVLGHIFEQSVNQKEMGAYYTPEEITSFMARESIHPRILDAVNEATGADYEEIDAIFGLDETVAQGESEDAVATDGGAITQQGAVDAASADHVETLYFDVLKDLHVLDPAVGSGAFLLAAEDVLLDIYLHAIEYFEQLYEDQPFGVSDRIKDELEAVNEASNKTLYAKRELILNNLYGVDIDDGAVEICKLRLWLSMVANIEDDPSAVDPLPNIDFNIRQGNTLIGYTELVEVSDDGDAKLTNYDAGVGESVQQRYHDVIEATEKHRAARTKSETERWRAETEQRRKKHTEELDLKVVEQFNDAGVDEVTADNISDYSPFHWVLEFPTVYRDGGFDIIVGNPPWDVVLPQRDDFFTKYDPLFRTRSSSSKDRKQEELLEDDSIEEEWEEYKERIRTLANYFHSSTQYTLQDSSVGGQSIGNENDLSMLFLERIFSLVSDEAYVSQILPGTLFMGAAAKDLRTHLINNCTLNYIVQFENHGIFNNVDDRYKFGIFVFKNSGETDAVDGRYSDGDLSLLEDIDSNTVTVTDDILLRYSPEARIFPLIKSETQVGLIEELLQHPSIGYDDNGWNITSNRELHSGDDRDRFVESEAESDYPVYSGSNIYQFQYTDDFIPELETPSKWGISEDRDPEKSAKRRIREKVMRSTDPDLGLKKAIYNRFNGSGSQKSFVNDLLEEYRGSPLSLDDVLLDCTEYRIVYRKVANSTNERTMIAAVIPKGVVCVDSIYTIRPYHFDISRGDLENEPLHTAYEKIYTDEELFTLLGLLNSFAFDYLMRTKVEENLVVYKLKESQAPRLEAGDEWFEYIWRRAARLNCYGDEFAELRERLGGIEPVTDNARRRKMQAEVDAAVFHAYGLGEESVKYILDNFHRVESPRMMTEGYFELVLEKYRGLADDKPTGD